MSKFNCSLFFGAAVLSLGLSSLASASTVSLTAGPFSSVAGVTNTSFNSGVLHSNFVASGPNAGVVTGSVADQYQTPQGDTTPYAYVGMGSSITATFSGIQYLGFYWGSPDDYNTVTLNDSNGVSTVYGNGGTAIVGLLTSDKTSFYANFLDTGADWTSVTFTSSASAFEFDNVATITSATPEPATIALLAGGLLAVGALRRRKKA